MYQRILVPIDGSFTSNLALQEAIKLAKRMGACLELVHVYEDAIYLVDENYFNYEELQKTIHDCGEKILTEAETTVKTAGIPVETRLIPSNNERIANILVEEARRWQAELIVIGTHGHSGFSRLLLGSVAEGIARIAPIPILLVRDTRD
ncbi:universal stress protein [Nitrosomonas eutropha]|uniref:Universal stress protein n=2 Tax=Nitrosomonas eutropha TaxID=916 RepID=A0ABX5M9L0_9PROT|nr:universal stress protein [Nitrosomonas eutropha]ABI59924.1 UspA domain protein [Nitrosomonas eutropha C91]PXV81621.1 nucleotide-binding universal stress UspA family protein [Nitrosomonas eutropha]